MQYYRKYLLKSSTVSYTTDIAPCCHGNQNIRIMLDRKEKKKRKRRKKKERKERRKKERKKEEKRREKKIKEMKKMTRDSNLF